MNAAEGETTMSDLFKCYICLSHFEKQTVGSLESCQHVFCLQCILQWSQTANTCPVDRISFAFIHQRPCPGGDIQKKIKVRTRKREEEDEEEGSSAVICERCGRSDRGRRLLVCAHCDSGYHTHCLRPSLNTRPEGEWICPECAVAHQSTETSTVEEEISDGELTDLLAEVDGVASTSSRLRASTINRSSSVAERRQSVRIQNRGDSRLRPRARTSLHVPKYLLQASRPVVTADEAVNHREAGNPSVKLKTKKRRKRVA